MATPDVVSLQKYSLSRHGKVTSTATQDMVTLQKQNHARRWRRSPLTVHVANHLLHVVQTLGDGPQKSGDGVRLIGIHRFQHRHDRLQQQHGELQRPNSFCCCCCCWCCWLRIIIHYFCFHVMGYVLQWRDAIKSEWLVLLTMCEPLFLAVRRSADKQKDPGSIPLRLSSLFKSCGLWTIRFNSIQFNSKKTLIIPQGAILLWSWRARKNNNKKQQHKV